MKYLNLFKTEVEYIQFKDSEDYVLPNVSYVEENGKVGFNPNVEPASPNLMVVYNVTDNTREYTLAGQYSHQYFTSMIIDGVEMEVDVYYQFETVGLHTVEFVLFDNTKIEQSMFNNVNCDMISVEFPSTITYIYSGIHLNKRETLKEITFHSKVAPLVTDNGVFDGISETGVFKYPKGSDYSAWIALLPEGWTTKEF